jgi:hypothetical protein
MKIRWNFLHETVCARPEERSKKLIPETHEPAQKKAVLSGTARHDPGNDNS